jgi:PIN domain nuclease of toxin-antitoxin system
MIEEAPETIVDTIRSAQTWRILPLEIEHIQALNEIARFSDHADPFDRVLIAQAHREGLRVITADAKFSRYKINVVW